MFKQKKYRGHYGDCGILLFIVIGSFANI